MQPPPPWPHLQPVPTPLGDRGGGAASGFSHIQTPRWVPPHPDPQMGPPTSTSPEGSPPTQIPRWLPPPRPLDRSPPTQTPRWVPSTHTPRSVPRHPDPQIGPPPRHPDPQTKAAATPPSPACPQRLPPCPRWAGIPGWGAFWGCSTPTPNPLLLPKLRALPDPLMPVLDGEVRGEKACARKGQLAGIRGGTWFV